MVSSTALLSCGFNESVFDCSYLLIMLSITSVPFLGSRLIVVQALQTLIVYSPLCLQETLTYPFVYYMKSWMYDMLYFLPQVITKVFVHRI